jgi:dCTP diphosphatase
MKSLDLEKISREITKFAVDRDWDQFHSIKNLSMALSVEASELLEISQWLTEEQSNQIKGDPDLKFKMEEEVADVFLYLLRIINKTEIDLETAVLNKLKKNTEKYPVELSKGNAKKYTDI